MHIIDFHEHHIDCAAALALACYAEERVHTAVLPQADFTPLLQELAGNGLGVAAFEQGRMVGFLLCCGPFDHAFRATDARGVFSPMGAHAAIAEHREAIYAAMYQAAAAKWVRAGAVSHAVCLYAHDEALQRLFFHYGFGLRCMDAMRPMQPVDCAPCEGFELIELPRDEHAAVYPLYLALHEHYCTSPFFMNRAPDTKAAFLAASGQEDVRIFAARCGDALCAFLKISPSGEPVAASGSTYRHITGAYCLPEYRGAGLYPNLLNFAISALQREGYTRLGVTFESFNPAGRGFWLKHFSAYTHSVVRRIDERILRRI